MHPEPTFESFPEDYDRVAAAQRRVVVADDNPRVLALIASTLRQDGHAVVEASNGFHLMHWVEIMTQWKEPVSLVDLIVTDVRMPLFSGLECLEALRAGGS